MDARREAEAAERPPVYAGPEPLSVWQRIEVVLYVPTHGRCDQHAVEIDGERVGLLSASEIGVRVREIVRKRPSLALLDEQIDAVTDAQWAKGVNKPIYAAHRAYARAVERASWAANNLTPPKE